MKQKKSLRQASKEALRELQALARIALRQLQNREQQAEGRDNLTSGIRKQRKT